MAVDIRSQPGHGPSDHVAPNGSNGAAPQTATRLDSWKDIAGYFQRDIRTVQLWEKKEGLPVHRHGHKGRSSVYAYPEELDAWLQTRARGHEAILRSEPEGQQIPRPRRGTRGWWLAAAIALVCAAGILLHRYRTQRHEPLASRMLAVLPFADLKLSQPREGGDYFADGFTDDLITDLGRSGQIAVMSSRSTAQFQGRRDLTRKIAERLHVSLILDGTVAQEGNTVRVTAQLLDANEDRQLWAGSYTGTQAGMLALQDDIAGEIAGDVIQALTGKRSQSDSDLKPADPQVRIDTLTGHYLWEQRNEADMRRAIAYFRQAIALDSGYAPAWVGLADSYNLMAVWGKMPSTQAFPQARSAAAMALSLDPNSAEAYNSLAFEVYRYEWDFPQADEDFRRAIALNPNYAVAHQWYGEFLGDLRRFDESIAELRRAKALDPLSPMVGSDLADGYIHAGRYAEAEAELRRILALHPNFVPAHSYLASACQAAGQTECADQELKTYVMLSGDTLSLKMFQLHQEALAGKTAEARRDLGRLVRSASWADLQPYQKAQLYFDAGELDAGYVELERAYRQRSWWLATLMVDPGFDSVRTQPRFIAMEKRVGLPVNDAPH